MKGNDNIYVINLLIDFGISSTFNIEFLLGYKGLDIMSLVDEPSNHVVSKGFTYFIKTLV